MPTDPADRRLACQMVYKDPRIFSTCSYDLERLGRIVDTTWVGCTEKCAGEGVILREGVEAYCLNKVQNMENYKDTVSFIPGWAIAWIIKIIVSILVDYWLIHEGKA